MGDMQPRGPPSPPPKPKPAGATDEAKVEFVRSLARTYKVVADGRVLACKLTSDGPKVYGVSSDGESEIFGGEAALGDYEGGVWVARVDGRTLTCSLNELSVTFPGQHREGWPREEIFAPADVEPNPNPKPKPSGAGEVVAPSLPPCAVEGLVELLSGCRLLDKLDAASAWCEEKGADSVAEVSEVGMGGELVAALGLKEVKARLLLKRLGEA